MSDTSRISKLRDYLFNIIDTLTTNKKYSINANWLSNDKNNYSIDKIPTYSVVTKWISGVEIHKDVYSFRSRLGYSSNEVNNLQNIGFFEKFEDLIYSNNKEGILPNINGIEKIECLNCGTLNNAETNTAEFDIQIQITYRKIDEREVSLWKK